MSEQEQDLNIQASEENLETNNTHEEQVINEEMVQLFGVPKNLVGKPITELAKSYKEASKKLTQLAQEKSALKKQIESQAVKDHNAPDPLEYDNNEAYNRAMNEYLDSVIEQRLASKLSPLQQQFVQTQTQSVFGAIQKQLPDVNPEEVAQEWMEENGYTPEDGQTIFQGDINRVIKSIVNYQKAKELDKVRTAIDKESGDKAIEAIKRSLKIQPKQSDLNSVTKHIPSGADSAVSRILTKLENEQQFLE